MNGLVIIFCFANLIYHSCIPILNCTDRDVMEQHVAVSYDKSCGQVRQSVSQSMNQCELLPINFKLAVEVAAARRAFETV